MTEQELLIKVKDKTNYTGDYHNDFLKGWIEEAKNILADSGVNDTYLNGDCSGIVSLIITELVDNGGKELLKESSWLSNRIAQIALKYPRREV